MAKLMLTEDVQGEMKHIMATVSENQSVLCCKHPEHILDSCTHCPMESGQKERLKYLGQRKEAVFRQEW